MWQVKEIETLFVGVFPLEKGSALDLDAWIHLSWNSGNTGWDVNRTHVFPAFHWKIPANKWNFEKVVLFSRGNACSIYEFSQALKFHGNICVTILKFGYESVNFTRWTFQLFNV